MTFTKEQLLNQARENVKTLKMAVVQTAFKDIRSAIELDLALAEMALAGMEAEPVAFTSDHYMNALKKAGEVKCWLRGDERDPGFNVSLYAAPPPLTTAERAELDNYRNAQKPVMFIDGDISPADAEKLAAAIREFNSEPSESVITAETAPVVPDIDSMRLIFEAVERESDDGFNLHKYGIGYADEATQKRWQSWLSCRAAMQSGTDMDAQLESARLHIAELEAAPPAPVGDGESPVPLMPDFPGRTLTQRECYRAGFETGKALRDGWVMVPVELSGDMTNAMTDAILNDLHNVDVWRSVLAAAPQQEAE